MKKIIFIIMNLLMLTSCITLKTLLQTSNNNCYPNHSFGNFTSYKVNITNKTPLYSVGIDDPKEELNLNNIDATLNNVFQCMQKFSEEPLTQEERVNNECRGEMDLSIKQCMIIKVAPDWYNSKCSPEEIFPCNVGNTRCLEKGQLPNPECPCSCRGIIQNQNTILITPNMKLLPAQIVTMMTGCLNPWRGRLAACADTSNIAKQRKYNEKYFNYVKFNFN